MNILHFTTSFLPNTGGTINRIKNLIEEDGNNHIFHLLENPTSLKESKYKKDNIPYKHKNMEVFVKELDKQILKIRNKIIRYLFAYYNLSKMKSKVNIDVVEIHSSIGSSLAGFLYAKKNKIPIIYNCHGLLSKKTGNYVIQKIIKLFERRILKLSRLIIVQTENEKKMINDEYKLSVSNVYVVHNSVDLNIFRPIKKSKMNNKFKILYSGYLNDINGVDLLLKWFEKFVQNYEYKNVELNILGWGPLQNIVKSYSINNQNIKYFGIISHKKMVDYYNDCNVFIIPRPSLPSTESLLPLKLLEVMACGKIVLASNVIPIKNVIEDNINGFLFEKENYQSFQEKLNFIIDNFIDFNNIKTNARETIINHFSLKTSREIMQKVYNILIC